jgi:sugar/nucleoside kinase (ribokinase family)
MARILLFGNLNRDRLLRLDRPVVPGGRLSGVSEGHRLGGAGANVGTALVWAGHQVRVCCAIGSDEAGDWLLEQARAQGLEVDWVDRRAPNTAEVLILRSPGGERTILRIDAPPPFVPAPDFDPDGFDCLFVNSQSAEVAAVMRRAAGRALVVAQMPRVPLGSWPAHILIASEDDLPARIAADPLAAGRELAGDLLQWVIVTKGVRGAVAYGAEGIVSVPASPAVRVVDTTGAGDAFAAAVVTGALAGWPMEQILAEASCWSALAIASPTSLPPESLRARLKSRFGRPDAS